LTHHPSSSSLSIPVPDPLELGLFISSSERVRQLEEVSSLRPAFPSSSHPGSAFPTSNLLLNDYLDVSSSMQSLFDSYLSLPKVTTKIDKDAARVYNAWKPLALSPLSQA